MSKTTKGMLAAFFGNFIFGLSFLFTKTALQTATPSVLLFWRFFLALSVMNVLRLFGVCKVSLKGKPIGLLILMGLCQPTLYFYFENYGLIYSNATFSSVMIALVPIASLLFGALFMRERPTVLQALCSAVSVGGVIWMALLQSAKGTITVWGVLLLVGAVLTAVGFNVISRRSSETVSAFERTYMMFLVGAASFFGVALVENIGSMTKLVIPFTDSGFVVSLLYLGVLSSVCAFLMINYANTYLPLSRATVFSNVITVVSVAVSIWLLHEPFNLYILVASLLIIFGIAGVQYFTRKN